MNNIEKCELEDKMSEIKRKVIGILNISFLCENAIENSAGTDFTKNFASIFDKITEDAIYIRNLIDDMAI